MSDTRENSTKTEVDKLNGVDTAASGSADGKTDGRLTPEQIAANLAETRERLADTVDALVGRVQPRQLAERAVGRARGFFQEPDGEVRTDRIVKIGAGVVGTVGGLVLLRRLVRGGGRKGRGARRRGRR